MSMMLRRVPSFEAEVDEAFFLDKLCFFEDAVVGAGDVFGE